MARKRTDGRKLWLARDRSDMTNALGCVSPAQ